MTDAIFVSWFCCCCCCLLLSGEKPFEQNMTPTGTDLSVEGTFKKMVPIFSMPRATDEKNCDVTTQTLSPV
jgi:hypothetical protein